MAAALAIYFALFVKHKLAAGERGMVLVLSMTLEQSKVVFDYVLGFLRASQVLAKEIASTTRSEIRLKNGIVIAVHRQQLPLGAWPHARAPASSTRSRTGATTPLQRPTRKPTPPCCRACSPPAACWSASPRPIAASVCCTRSTSATSASTATTPWWCRAPRWRSTPRSTRAPSRAQQEADPTAARSEWDAQFRDDLAGFLDDELDRRCRRPCPPTGAAAACWCVLQSYVDASGGAVGGDAYCIAHRAQRARLLRPRRGARPRWSLRPGGVDAKSTPQLCKQYRCLSVTGDKYAREWVSSAWRKCWDRLHACHAHRERDLSRRSAVVDAGSRAHSQPSHSAARIAPAGTHADAHGQGSGRASKERARRLRQRLLSARSTVSPIAGRLRRSLRQGDAMGRRTRCGEVILRTASRAPPPLS